MLFEVETCVLSKNTILDKCAVREQSTSTSKMTFWSPQDCDMAGPQTNARDPENIQMTGSREQGTMPTTEKNSEIEHNLLGWLQRA